MLNSDNFKIWKERILLQLGMKDIDYAILKDEPAAITAASTPDHVDLYEKWQRSNRLSVLFIKTHISAGIRGSVEHHEKVMPLLKAIDDQFVTSDKALASTLIFKFCSSRLTTVKGVREHIMKMRDLAAQLKTLEVEISDSFLVYYILNTLPHQYRPFKISYNTHKDKWSINELMTMCVQEEGRLSMENLELGESVLVTTGNKDRTKFKGKGKVPPQGGIKKESKCFFCKKNGHMKKDCMKFKAWFEKKGNSVSYVCYESNMVDSIYNTWWIDSGSTIHVSNTLQGMRNLRKPQPSEQCIYSGNKMRSHVEAIGTCSLILSTGFVLNLEKTFYIPSFSRNLISVSRLVPLGYSFMFNKTSMDLFYANNPVGSGTLSSGLFSIELQNNSSNDVMHVQAGIKRSVMNEDSSILWHRRLGHISIQRIKRLVNEGVLSTLDFTDFETCVDCIKGKQTNKSKKVPRGVLNY